MEKQEAFKILVLIEFVYPNFKLKNETVLKWFQICGDLDFSFVMKKLFVHFRSSPYPPKIEEIACYLSNHQHFPAVKAQRIPSLTNDYVLANSYKQ